MTIDLSLRHKRLLIFILALLLVMTGTTLASAQNPVHRDGRINQVAHFGGDALYCVDRNFVPTNQYSDFGDGGFRLLNMSGQELWFVPAAQIAIAVAEAKETGQGTLVAEGQGSYGPVRIHVYVTAAGDDYFVFTGYDEYGKQNSLTFKFCIPVGPIPSAPDKGSSEEPCLPSRELPKATNNLFFGGPPVPCLDECDLTIINILLKPRTVVSGLNGLDPCFEFCTEFNLKLAVSKPVPVISAGPIIPFPCFNPCLGLGKLLSTTAGIPPCFNPCFTFKAVSGVSGGPNPCLGT